MEWKQPLRVRAALAVLISKDTTVYHRNPDALLRRKRPFPVAQQHAHSVSSADELIA